MCSLQCAYKPWPRLTFFCAVHCTSAQEEWTCPQQLTHWWIIFWQLTKYLPLQSGSILQSKILTMHTLPLQSCFHQSCWFCCLFSISSVLLLNNSISTGTSHQEMASLEVNNTDSKTWKSHTSLRLNVALMTEFLSLTVLIKTNIIKANHSKYLNARCEFLKCNFWKIKLLLSAALATNHVPLCTS